jgi:hypothetical protein
MPNDESILDKLAKAANWTVPEVDEEEFVNMEISLDDSGEAEGIGDN